eukprot:2098883-Rhodomonas_salina.1
MGEKEEEERGRREREGEKGRDGREDRHAEGGREESRGGGGSGPGGAPLSCPWPAPALSGTLAPALPRPTSVISPRLCTPRARAGSSARQCRQRAHTRAADPRP